jgi:hypothetical protein
MRPAVARTMNEPEGGQREYLPIWRTAYPRRCPAEVPLMGARLSGGILHFDGGSDSVGAGEVVCVSYERSR